MSCGMRYLAGVRLRREEAARQQAAQPAAAKQPRLRQLTLDDYLGVPAPAQPEPPDGPPSQPDTDPLAATARSARRRFGASSPISPRSAARQPPGCPTFPPPTRFSTPPTACCATVHRPTHRPPEIAYRPPLAPTPSRALSAPHPLPLQPLPLPRPTPLRPRHLPLPRTCPPAAGRARGWPSRCRCTVGWVLGWQRQEYAGCRPRDARASHAARSLRAGRQLQQP